MLRVIRKHSFQNLSLERGESKNRKIQPADLRGDIVIKNIDFRYGTRAMVLKDLSLTIKQGEKIAFVGESGSGKTTLVKLLMNCKSPDSF